MKNKINFSGREISCETAQLLTCIPCHATRNLKLRIYSLNLLVNPKSCRTINIAP